MGLLKTNLDRFQDAIKSLDTAREKASKALQDEIDRICKAHGLSFSTYDWKFRGENVDSPKVEKDIDAFLRAVNDYEDTFKKPWKRR